MEKDITVSVCCITYNHEPYIRDCLEGFVNQKVDFKYEVIVHDDASTDRTADVIREYEKKYPDIIKPIYQTENQYSKKIGIFRTFIYPNVRGKYMAICEGDDFWIDENKLQKQVDYLEKNPDCTYCFTNGIVHDLSGNEKPRPFLPWHESDKIYYTGGNKIYTLENFYQVNFVPAASVVYPSKWLKSMPVQFYKGCPYGDLKTRLYMTALGYAYFIDEITCVYRRNVPNSAMSMWSKESRKQAYQRSLSAVEMINDVDEFSKHKYTEGLNKIKEIHLDAMINNITKSSMSKNQEAVERLKKYTFSKRVKVCLKMILPECIYNKIKIIRRLKRR